MGISMKLPLMPIYTVFPGDYRTRAQTMADFAGNKEFEAQRLKDGSGKIIPLQAFRDR